MPDYVPIQDLTILNTLDDTDYIPVSDGSGAYAVRGGTFKAYVSSDVTAAKTAAEAAQQAAEAAQEAAETAVEEAEQAVDEAEKLFADPTFSDMKTALGPYMNLIDERHLLEANGWAEDNGVYTGTVGALFDAFRADNKHYPVSAVFQENTSYYLSLYVKCNEVGMTGSNGLNVYMTYTDGTYDYKGVPRTQTDWYKVEMQSNPEKTLSTISFSRNTASYNSNEWSIKEMQMNAGGPMAYIPYVGTSVDLVARGLPSTYDTTDRAAEIMSLLDQYKYCELGSGDYYISSIVMPEGSRLTGKGNATRLYFLDSAVGNAISMKSMCRVDNIFLLGSTDETYDTDDNSGKFPGSENKDFTGETNLWEDGDQSVSDSGYKHLVLTNPLPAGDYYFHVDDLTSQNTDLTSVAVSFSTSHTTSIGSATIVATALVPKGTDTGVYVTIPKDAYSVRLMSGTNTLNSEGYTAEYEGISVYSIASRNGIAWIQEGTEYLQAGSISACRIERFSGAGILGMDTGTPVAKGLSITNCQILLCNVGVYFRRNCEFNQIVSCLMNKCYYGVLNRGGNNIFEACVISGNYINVQQDVDEGQNTGHGMINSCKLHHSGYSSNDNYAIVIKDTGRIVVTGCEIADKVRLKSTNGNVISDCAMFDVTFEVVGGACSLISNCIFRTAVMSRTFNTAAVISNCYDRDGNPITWEA